MSRLPKHEKPLKETARIYHRIWKLGVKACNVILMTALFGVYPLPVIIREYAVEPHSADKRFVRYSKCGPQIRSFRAIFREMRIGALVKPIPCKDDTHIFCVRQQYDVSRN